jgi:hypothetical protein
MISMLEGSAWRRPSTCHKAGDPRPDAGPQSEKLGAQQPAMVIGQRAWTNQAHVSAHNVPYLGQHVDDVTASHVLTTGKMRGSRTSR